MPSTTLHRFALLVYSAVLLALIAPASITLAAEATERPNIIYIMVDDLGYGDLSCYGQQTLKTPNIDHLAEEGLRFTDHYSGHTVCRPSRLVLWTGQHSGHTAIHANTNYFLQPSDVTVGERLQRAGYVTGGVGKWANGDVTNSGHPNLQGFDFWMGYLDQGRAHNYYPEYLWRNTEKVILPGNKEGPKRNVSISRKTYSHDVMTEEALGFIRRSAAGDKPFLLHVHWTIPHTNNEGGRATGDGQEIPDWGEFASKDWPNPEKGFAAMIKKMDADVGRMMQLLKELKIDENTVVFFTSDNGPHQEGGHKMEFFDSNGDLRGYKRDLYEGGVRVPMIARWPGKIKPGSTTSHPSAFWDWVPTACQLAGAKSPQGVDGISYVPTLLGQKQQAHDYLYWRYGDKQAVRQGPYKGVRLKPKSPIELYNLTNDIGEKTNIAADHPEVVKQIEAAMQEAKTE